MQSASWKIEQFNLRASRLDASRFLQWVRTRGNKQPDMRELLAGSWLPYEGLHREDVDSFVLNLRVLIQDQDGFSIRCLGKVYETFPDDYFQVKQLFNKFHSGLQAYLSAKSFISIGGSSFTHKQLLDTILYGGFAHSNPKHYGNFVRLTKSGLFSLFSFVEFMNVISVLNSRVQQIAILNTEVLSWLKEPN